MSLPLLYLAYSLGLWAALYLRGIEESQTQWTIVRPGALSNAPARGTCRNGRNVGSLLWTLGVPRADVARFMLDELAHPRHLGCTVGVTS